jgi:hypothetical protein
MRIHIISLVAFFSVIVGGCTWVKPSPDADQIIIVPADRVADCKKLGEISSYTKAKVAGVSRKAAKVKSELETLAKIEAAEMGADTLVVATLVQDGRQTFIGYRCQI